MQEKEDVHDGHTDVERLLDHEERERRAVAHLHVVRLRDRRRARVDQAHHPARPPQVLERVVAHRVQLVVLGQKRLEVVRQRHRHPRLQPPRTVREPRVVRRRHLQGCAPLARAPPNHRRNASVGTKNKKESLTQFTPSANVIMGQVLFSFSFFSLICYVCVVFFLSSLSLFTFLIKNVFE